MSKHIMYFDEKAHKYTDESGALYTSVTQLISKYVPEFQTVERATSCSRSKKSKYYGWEVKAILKDWKDITKKSIDIGNNTHNFLETAIKDAGSFYKDLTPATKNQIYTIEDIVEGNANITTIDTLRKYKLHEKYPRVFKLLCKFVDEGFSIFSEVCVFHPNFKVAGLKDLCITNFKEFITGDWKTNKYPLIPYSTPDNKWRSGYYKKDILGNITEEYIFTNEYLLPPVHYFQNSTYVHYALQTSIYSYLTKLITGWELKGILLCHINEHIRTTDDLATVNLYEIEYMEEAVLSLFDDFNRNGSTQTKLVL